MGITLSYKALFLLIFTARTGGIWMENTYKALCYCNWFLIVKNLFKKKTISI